MADQPPRTFIPPKASMLERLLRPAAALQRDCARAQWEMQGAVPYTPAYQSRMDTYWSLSLSMSGVREINRFNLRRMRDRARQNERENVLACAILDRYTDNVIGAGLRVQPATSDPDFNKQVLELWEDWKDSAEITGRYAFGEWQAMKYRSHARDGDVGTVLVSRGDDAYLQTISGDYIDSLSGAILDNVTNVHGMELGPDQRPVRYHIKSADDKGWWTETIVPARNFVFFPRCKQLTDYRGEPLFAPIFTLLEQIGAYVDAEVMKQRIAACQALIIKRQASGLAYGALPTTTNAQGAEQASWRLEPGLVQVLATGEEMQAFTPSSGAQDFVALMRCLIGFLGLNCGLTLQMLLMDYGGMSYTAGKAGTLQSHHHFRMKQSRFVERALKRIYQWWLSKQVKAGRLIVPSGLKGNFWRHLWIAPGFPLLDPNKEIAAQMAEIDAGLGTYSDIALSRGHIFEELCERRARDEALLDQFGIVPSRSTLTRDLVAPAAPAKPPSGAENDDDLEDEQADET
jgi:lambda family phage portal protein